jgi:hypothetical protein
VEGTRRKFFGAGKCHLPTNRPSSTGGNRMATTRRKTFGGEAAGATGPRSERSAAPLRCDQSSELRASCPQRPGLIGRQNAALDDQLVPPARNGGRALCAAGKIRTCYPRLRRPVLYPDELQPRVLKRHVCRARRRTSSASCGGRHLRARARSSMLPLPCKRHGEVAERPKAAVC